MNIFFAQQGHLPLFFLQKYHSKNSYFILEHDPTYASDEDSDYDLYYEDVLPIDHNEIKNQSTNKNTLKKILIASAIIILIIILIISISNSLTQPEF